jgi:hypothetical protein
MAERLEAVVALRLNGKEFSEIAQYCADKGWPTNSSSVYLLIRRADAKIGQYVDLDRYSLVGRQLTRRNVLWQRALEAGNLELALKVSQDECNLLGLYPPKPLPTTPPVQVNNVVLSDADRDALRRMALARLGRGDPGADRIGDIPAYRQVLPAAPGDPDRRGDGAGRPANATASGAADSNAAPVLPSEPPVLPVLRTEQPVPAGPPAPQPAPPGPPPPGKEYWLCDRCARRWVRQPGVRWTGCPVCYPT